MLLKIVEIILMYDYVMYELLSLNFFLIEKIFLFYKNKPWN